jgi:hypothetical protein
MITEHNSPGHEEKAPVDWYSNRPLTLPVVVLELTDRLHIKNCGAPEAS